METKKIILIIVLCLIGFILLYSNNIIISTTSNITNNITQNITYYTNITNNITQNITYYSNITNNITNNISYNDTGVLFRNGTRTLTNNWNVGGYSITNINTLESDYIENDNTISSSDYIGTHASFRLYDEEYLEVLLFSDTESNYLSLGHNDYTLFIHSVRDSIYLDDYQGYGGGYLCIADDGLIYVGVSGCP